MRDDRRAGSVQPGVAVGVVEVPMGVDQVPDRVGAERREGRGDLALRDADSSVDEELAVRAGQDGHVPARAGEDADVSAERLHVDRPRGRGVLDVLDDATFLREEPAGRE